MPHHYATYHLLEPKILGARMGTRQSAKHKNITKQETPDRTDGSRQQIETPKKPHPWWQVETRLFPIGGFYLPSASLLPILAAALPDLQSLQPADWCCDYLLPPQFSRCAVSASTGGNQNKPSRLPRRTPSAETVFKLINKFNKFGDLFIW